MKAMELLPFADIVPPVTHPATTVLVVSCFARALTRVTQHKFL